MITEGATLYAQWTIATSVNDVTAEKIRLYPNPASSSVIISNLTSGDFTKIYSIAGTLVKQVQLGYATFDRT